MDLDSDLSPKVIKEALRITEHTINPRRNFAVVGGKPVIWGFLGSPGSGKTNALVYYWLQQKIGGNDRFILYTHNLEQGIYDPLLRDDGKPINTAKYQVNPTHENIREVFPDRLSNNNPDQSMQNLQNECERMERDGTTEDALYGIMKARLRRYEVNKIENEGVKDKQTIHDLDSLHIQPADKCLLILDDYKIFSPQIGTQTRPKMCDVVFTFWNWNDERNYPLTLRSLLTHLSIFSGSFPTTPRGRDQIQSKFLIDKTLFPTKWCNQIIPILISDYPRGYGRAYRFITLTENKIMIGLNPNYSVDVFTHPMSIISYIYYTFPFPKEIYREVFNNLYLQLSSIQHTDYPPIIPIVPQKQQQQQEEEDQEIATAMSTEDYGSIDLSHADYLA